MGKDSIIIRGAREHNLKNIDVDIPKFTITVITGVSGSGKSSLAFDTLYAEGQRRYVESLSSYARQFIHQMEKPDVELIDGLFPAIAVEQKKISHNPRSTVGTVTEIYDYLRVLFARAGVPHCPKCGREVKAQSAQEIVDMIMELTPGTRFQVLAPVVRNRKGRLEHVLSRAREEGYVRVRIDNIVRDLGEEIRLRKDRKHTVEFVIDRLVMPDRTGGTYSAFRSRLTDSVETALRKGEGLCVIHTQDEGDRLLSEQNACAECGISFPRLTPAMMSFNSPSGMCPECNGLGVATEFDPDLFTVSDKSLHEGGLKTYGVLENKKHTHTYSIIEQVVRHFGDSMDTPWKDLSADCRDTLLFGGDVKVKWKSQSRRASWEGEWDYEGTVPATRRRYLETKSEYQRRWYGSFMSRKPCPACEGERLRPESAGVTVKGKTIAQATRMTIQEALKWAEELHDSLPSHMLDIVRNVITEIRDRLSFLIHVGLHYLTLDRTAPTLSGGEGQRIQLASHIGSRLGGVLYVLDEPTIGLHKRDTMNLLSMLKRLRDLGNTIVVIEHDEESIRNADWIIDLGPGPGIQGGEVVATGGPTAVAKHPKSLTGAYLRGDITVSSPYDRRRKARQTGITLKGVRQNNLKNLTVTFPFGLFTCVTGVSGSGKSSLVSQTLYPALARELQGSDTTQGTFRSMTGLGSLDKVINITQDPIGRTPRSNPSTYVKVLGPIRELFALTREAKKRGYRPGRFSFNVKGGRCEACRGYGRRKIEMHFLPDVWVTCDVCKGSRYNRETLQVRFKGHTIADVLNMDVDEALVFFQKIPKITRILTTLSSVGLGYIKLGQSATTLSGGEAQRVKLAKELARVSTGNTVYILDEPTTGLHFADIQKLLNVLHQFVENGNTVIVIEHNMDVIKTADWIIDLGPEGGENGGEVIAQGPPKEIVTLKESHTGQLLRDHL